MIVETHGRDQAGRPLCGHPRSGLEFSTEPTCKRCKWTATRSYLAGLVYCLRADGLTLSAVGELLGVSHPRVAFIERRVVERIEAAADVWQREARTAGA
ncbi:MAG: hypothetical protein EPN98_21765 [Phenylobacterium sp.]|uniref:hypothetical protein n=1 Tax=Phenylobacterium sp. TaxID=1871053 RepID=UPI0011F4C474|nr:hypothetical protein [Phenylobacterium sp.]TAL29072.1 MAG: hypothetical protein EPN98_21765 [Phenylobacterium sp.]